MNNVICLDNKYSTTRLLIKKEVCSTQIKYDNCKDMNATLKGGNKKCEGGLRIRQYSKKSYKYKPLISIVTVVLNGDKYLEETIQSVINQSYENVEYIIIDGGSLDGTLDIVKKYENKVDYWISEGDKGQTDALVKGFNICNGEIL